jgi:benzoate-CoA ligase family protein
LRRAADVPLRYNAVDVLEHNLAARADKIALHSAERSLTFAEMSAEVSSVADALAQLGFRQGEPVAILCLDGAEWMASFFGIVKAGGVAVGLNTMLTPREYAYILGDCRPRILVVHETLSSLVEEVRDGVASLEHVVVVGEPGRASDIAYADWVAGGSDDVSAAPTHRDDLCMLNYSSGTTGEPKGIPHAHKDLPLTAQLWGVDAVGMAEDDITSTVAKLFFTYGSIGTFCAWHVGASIVLFSAPSRRATNVLEAIDRFKPTFFHGVPTGYATMLAVEGFTERYDLSSLRVCISAGEGLPVPIWDAWKAETGLEILEGIGTTENLALFLQTRAGDVRPGSTGKPVDGFEVRVVDDEGRTVGPGEVGDLLVRGETAALSYLHQYEKSRRMFVGDWLATGDRYSYDEDGFYFHAGRSDEMLKVGGIWLAPTEIEGVLAAHEAVVESAVIGVPDRSDLIKPKAFVVLREGYEPTDELAKSLIDYCAGAMAAYKRPRWVAFVDELPRTATGKIQRSKLQELEAASR